MADGKVVIETLLDSTGIKDGISKLNSLATGGLKATTAAITAVCTGLLGMAGYAIKAGSDFEASMSQVEAISGASSQTVKTASGKMVNGLTAITDKAKEMGASTKFSATESAEALNYMAMAGWTSQDMYDGLAGIMNLAAASGENLATTSDIVTDALTAFGMKAGESGHFADVLAKTSASANTNVSLLGESFKYVAPLCGTLKYSAEDASIALGLMANAGIKGSQAGTSLKTALANLSAPTDKQAAMMEKLGISLLKSDGSMKSLREVMINLRGSFKDLGEAEQTAAASTIFGKEAMSGMLNIINASDEDFEKLAKSIDNCDGAAQNMAETMQDNLQGQITILQSGIEGLGIAVYEKLQDPLKNLAIKGQEYVQRLTDAFNNAGFEGLVSEIGYVLADAASMVTAAAPNMVKAAVSVIEAFLSGISSNLPQITQSAMNIGVELISGVLTILPQALSLGIEFLANLATGISQALPQLASSAEKCLITLHSGFKDNAKSLLDAGLSLLQSLASGITQALPSLIPLALQAIISLADGFISNIGSIVDIGIQLIMALADGVVNSIPLLITEVPRIINDFWSAFDTNAVKLLKAGLNLIVMLGKGIIQNVPLIISNAGEIVSAIFNTISHINLLSAGKTLIKNLAAGLKAMGPAAKTAVSDIAKNLVNTIKGTNWAQLGRQVMSLLKNGISGMASALAGAARAIATATANGIKNTNWQQLGRTVMTLLKNGISAMASALSDAAKAIGRAAFNAIKNINWLSLGKTVVNLLISGIKLLLSSVASALKSIGKAGMNAFKGLDWKSIGSNVVRGIINGVTGMAGSLFSSLKNLASSALSAAKNALGIKSPSKKFAEIGKYVVAGLAQGIDRNRNSAEKSASLLSETLLEAAEAKKELFDGTEESTIKIQKETVEKSAGMMADSFIPSEEEFSKYFSQLKTMIDNSIFDLPVVKKSREGITPESAKDRAEELFEKVFEYIDDKFKDIQPSGLKEAMKEGIKEGMDGMEVKMDGRTTGKIIAPYVDKHMPKPAY